MSSCAAWRSLATGGLWWPGVEGLKWSFLLFFFFITRLGFLAAWLSCGCSFSRTCHDVCEHEFIPLAGRKEGRKVGRSVGWLVWTEGNEASCRTKTKKKKGARGLNVSDFYISCSPPWWPLTFRQTAVQPLYFLMLRCSDLFICFVFYFVTFNLTIFLFFVGCFLSSTCKFYIYRFFRFHFFNLASTRGLRETFFPIFRKATVQKCSKNELIGDVNTSVVY